MTTKPERFFLFTAMIFGLFFVFTIPPFNNPDEPVHFFRIYQLSSFQLFGEESKQGIQTTIPSSFVRGVQDNISIGGKQINFHPETKASPAKILQTVTYPLNENKKEKTLFSSAASYAPTSYLPQIVTMWFGRLLNFSPVGMLYAVRLVGLALYVGVIYYALKLLPYRKWTIALLAVLPMSLAQAAAVTADSSLIAFLILFLSIILYLRQSKIKISNHIKVLLAVTCVVLGMSKQIFILAIPLLLLIPVRAFVSKTARYMYIGGALTGVILLSIGWGIINPSFQAGLANTAAAADAHARILATLHHPAHLVIVGINTFLSQNSNNLYVMFAGDFGWLDTQLPLWAVSLVLGVVLFALVAEYETKVTKPSRYYNSSIIGVASALFLATCAVFYVYWTPVDSRQILGLQGRYFIPVVILLGVLQGRKMVEISERQYSKLIIIVMPIVLITSVLTIVNRFYWSI